MKTIPGQSVILDGIGAGDRKLARIDSGGGLEKVFDQAVRRMRLRTTALEEYPFFLLLPRTCLSLSRCRILRWHIYHQSG